MDNQTDERMKQIAAALRGLADQVDAGRVVDIAVSVEYGIQEKRNATFVRELEPNGMQTITIVAHCPRVLAGSFVCLDEQRSLPKL